jgi:hypothetical protein
MECQIDCQNICQRLLDTAPLGRDHLKKIIKPNPFFEPEPCLPKQLNGTSCPTWSRRRPCQSSKTHGRIVP